MNAPVSYRGPADRRLDAIVDELRRLGGPGVGGLTVLDFGAHNGHIAYALGEMGYIVTAIDDGHAVEHPNVSSVVRRVTVHGITKLPRFDVVLALSILQHFEDWDAAFVALRALARRAMIVEVPHPKEELRQAPARRHLPQLDALIRFRKHRVIATTPATRQPELLRETRVVQPLLRGTVHAGGGHHANSQQRFGHLFEPLLGYRPFPGSLNLKLDRVHDLGPEQFRLRPDKKRDYRMWKGYLPVYPDVQVHIMDVGARGHGPDCVELLSPIRLRDLPGVETGTQWDVEVAW